MMTQHSEFLTPRLRLRRFRPEDLPFLQKYAVREYFWRFLPLDQQTPESIELYLDRRLEDDWGNGEYCCAVELIEAQHLIGTVRIATANTKHRSGDIGYALNHEYSGNGYMTEAVNRILQVGFQVLDLHRIWAVADVENTASWRLMERVGMLREGMLRQDKLVRGTWRDSYLYSILASDT